MVAEELLRHTRPVVDDLDECENLPGDGLQNAFCLPLINCNFGNPCPMGMQCSASGRCSESCAGGAACTGACGGGGGDSAASTAAETIAIDTLPTYLPQDGSDR